MNAYLFVGKNCFCLGTISYILQIAKKGQKNTKKGIYIIKTIQ